MSAQETDPESLLEEAFQEAVGRKEGTRQPKGGYTQPGLWEPAPDERRPCCDDVTQPRPAWGWSLKKHCESTKHVAQLFGVPEGALARRVRVYMHERNKRRREGVPTVLFADNHAPRPTPGIVLQQVDRLLGKLEGDLATLRRQLKGAAYGEMRAPETGELDYWLRMLR